MFESLINGALYVGSAAVSALFLVGLVGALCQSRGRSAGLNSRRPAIEVAEAELARSEAKAAADRIGYERRRHEMPQHNVIQDATIRRAKLRELASTQSASV